MGAQQPYTGALDRRLTDARRTNQGDRSYCLHHDVNEQGEVHDVRCLRIGTAWLVPASTRLRSVSYQIPRVGAMPLTRVSPPAPLTTAQFVNRFVDVMQKAELYYPSCRM